MVGLSPRPDFASYSQPRKRHALEVLKFNSRDSPSGTIELLMGPLASGAAPFLREIGLGYGEESVDGLAAMLEARARLPSCRGLEMLPGIDRGIFGCPEPARNRLLCALLPSVTELKLCWGGRPSFDACFVSGGMCPHLKKLSIEFPLVIGGYNIVPPSMEMLESMPVLEALTHKASIENYTLDYSGWCRILGVLAGAVCALHLTSLSLDWLAFWPASMATFATLLSTNAFPALQSLTSTTNVSEEYDSFEFLLQGLQAPACETRLTKLVLGGIVGSGDRGMTAIASAVRAGLFNRMEDFFIHSNSDVTAQGI